MKGGYSQGKTKHCKWGKMGHEQRAGNSSGGGQGTKKQGSNGPRVGPR